MYVFIYFYVIFIILLQIYLHESMYVFHIYLLCMKLEAEEEVPEPPLNEEEGSKSSFCGAQHIKFFVVLQRSNRSTPVVLLV